MKFTIKQIADLLGADIKGDENLEISGVAKIDESAKEGSICFLANPKYENFLYTTQATAVIVRRDFVLKKEVKPVLLRVDNPLTAFTILLEEYGKRLKMHLKKKTGIEQPCHLGNNFTSGQDVYIGSFVYIGNNCCIGDRVEIHPQCHIGDNVIIGDDTILYAGVKIHENSQIGKHCTLHPGAVVGSEGFGFAPQADGTYRNIPQLGNVVIEDYVNIGANTTIDRATIGSTIIRQGVKLDNLIQIGHNVEIGENTVISAQTGISGSSKIGKNCVIGGQVGFSNSIKIADNTKIGAQSGINGNIKKSGRSLLGYPAFDYIGFMKSSVIFRKLPDLQRRIEQLEETLKNNTEE